MQELTKRIRKAINELPNLREENIKQHIVVDIFLCEMGYATSKWDYEDSVYQDRADIVYKEDGKALLLVETKGLQNGNKLDEKDLKQLSEYLNSYKSGIEWGLLTNGLRYILFNNSIDGDIEDRIVLDISFEPNIRSDRQYLKYFSYENIFINKTSHFFADIAQFKSYVKKHRIFDLKSWRTYKSTLFRFFDFYAISHDYKVIGKAIHEPLSRIDAEAFIDFAKNNTSKEFGRIVKSKETIKNDYSHLSSFFKVLSEYGYIKDSLFIQDRTMSLSIFEDTEKRKNENHLSKTNYKKILNFLYLQKTNYRDIAVFLLCSYYGFERKNVLDLKWENIDFKNGTLKITNRSFKMCDLIELCFRKIEVQKKQDKNKLAYVFTSSKSKQFKKVNESTINDIFNKIANIDVNNEMWKFYSPQYVRECLVAHMFDAGYSLEQIMYYVGLDSNKISNYISHDKIIAEGKKRIKNGMKSAIIHPFQYVVDEFYKAISNV